MRTRMRGGAAVAVALSVTVAAAGCGGKESGSTGSTPATPSAYAPSGRQWVGLVSPELLTKPLPELRDTFHAMAAAGDGVLRQTFQWNYIEPSQGRWLWGYYDSLVQAAAENGIQILPVVFNVRDDQQAAPKKHVKITPTTTMPPKDPAAFGQFAAALVKRYGPTGEFWKAHPDVPKVPMTSWQIWNEPNLPVYWGGRANQKEYGELLVASAKAIHAVDPKAEIVTGGIPESKLGIPMDDYVHLLSQTPARSVIDTVAIHPYGHSVDGVIAGMVRARKDLDRDGLTNVGLWVTEFGWATGAKSSAFTVGPKKQGQNIAETFQRAAALSPQLKLRGLVYYSWRDLPVAEGAVDFWGNHTGLRTKSGKAKPSLSYFTSAASAVRAGE